jgi:hypothetical protein
MHWKEVVEVEKEVERKVVVGAQRSLLEEPHSTTNC